MLHFRAFADIDVTWEYVTETFESSDDGVEGMFQAFYRTELADHISSRDLFLEQGISGKVWDAIQKTFGSAVSLISLEPEPAPEQKPGVLY